MSRIFYKNDNDVHLYTRECAEFAAGLDGIFLPVTAHHIKNLIKALRDRFGDKFEPLFQKMFNRTVETADGFVYYDRDTNTNIWRLMSITLSLPDLLEETLEEMGGHCVQGDSHRLISLIATLIR